MSPASIIFRQRGRLIVVLSVALLAMTALMSYLIWAGYPFIAPVGLAREDVPVGWRAHALVVGLLGLLLVLLPTSLLHSLGRAEAREGQAVAALTQSDANLRTLSDNAIIGFSVLREGCYAFANNHVARRLGYSLEELRQIAVADVIHPDDRAFVLERYRRRVAGEDVPSRYQARMVTKDGRTLPVEIHAAVASWDGQPADIVFTTDISARKAAETELAAARANLTAAIEGIEYSIVLWDTDDRLVLFNQRFRDLFPDLGDIIEVGLRYEDFARAVAGHDLIAGVPGQEIEASFGERLARHRRADGTPMLRKYADGRIIRVSERPARGGGIVGIAIDVTEQLRTEMQLREAVELEAKAIADLTASEANLRALSENATLGILVLDEGRLVFANPRLARWLGYGIDELGQVPFSDLIHPDDRAMMVDRYRRRLAGENVPNHYEARALTKDGRTFPILLNAFMTRWNGRRADMVFVIDITERQAAETELTALRANLTDAIESIEHGIVLWDSQDRLVLFNQRFREIIPDGGDLVEAGLRFEDFVRAVAGRDVVADALGQAIEASIAERTARHRRADGTPFLRKLADGRVHRISERPARSGGIVGIAIDVTEQLRTERLLREAVKMEAIGKLTGGMAHDFNNYLAVIMGNLELLKEFGIVDPEATDWIDEARAGAVRAAELTRSLLAFARRQPLDPRPTDVNRRVAAIAELLRRTLGADIVLTTALVPDLWPVTIDGAQLDACIVNLANNARDAMPSGGSLAIATRNTALDEIYARANLDAVAGDYVLIEMSDSGIGMAPEVVASAFEPFFTTKRPGHGTGLGLSMVYGFVKQSGGHIKIGSEVGHGTAVRLYLPRDHAAEAVAVATTGAQVVVPIGGTETILVVEDNEQMRQMAVTALARRGYRVIEAANGAAALAILEQPEPPVDLLFTDIVMPGKPDGHELARLAIERRPDIRILLTSGYPGGRFHDHGIDAPPANLIGKPYQLGDLLRAVRAALGSSRA